MISQIQEHLRFQQFETLADKSVDWMDNLLVSQKVVPKEILRELSKAPPMDNEMAVSLATQKAAQMENNWEQKKVAKLEPQQVDVWERQTVACLAYKLDYQMAEPLAAMKGMQRDSSMADLMVRSKDNSMASY